MPKIKEGTIPLFQISQRETIQKVHIPCTFTICKIRVYYTKFNKKNKRQKHQIS